MINTMTDLVTIIKKNILVDTDVKNFKSTLNLYNGIDWKDYINISNNNNNVKYNKVYIYNSDIFELSIITWLPFITSPIHNHAKNGCLIKILDGELIEEQFSYELVKTKENKTEKGEFSYIDNTIGLHKVSNPNSSITVSLHLYSPGNFKTKYFT